MKMVKTEFKHTVNESSSWIVYITKTYEAASDIHHFAMTQQAMIKATGADWYYSVSTVKVEKDCRIPEFFHDRDYYATIIEHNNGDWKAAAKYDLYIVE